MTRRKPTAASNITPDMIAKALSKQDRERYRATLERAGIPEDVIETSLDSGAITVVAASLRLLSVRANAAQQSIQARKGASVAGSTPERAQHARDGLEAEPVSHNSGHEIARVRVLSPSQVRGLTGQHPSLPRHLSVDAAGRHGSRSASITARGRICAGRSRATSRITTWWRGARSAEVCRTPPNPTAGKAGYCNRVAVRRDHACRLLQTSKMPWIALQSLIRC